MQNYVTGLQRTKHGEPDRICRRHLRTDRYVSHRINASHSRMRREENWLSWPSAGSVLEQELGERTSRAIIAAPLAREEFLSLDDGWHH